MTTPGRAPATGAARARQAIGRLGGAHDAAAERALLGDVIRAVDAVAARCDELAGRLTELQQVVEEAVVVFGQDLAAARAVAVGDRRAPGSPPG